MGLSVVPCQKSSPATPGWEDCDVKQRLPWKAAGLGGLMLVVAAVAAGLAPGTDVPTIHIDAFNDNRGEFCVTCEAGNKPAMVAFVKQNDDTTRKLMAALDKAYKDNKSKRLYAGIVILDGGGTKGLKQFVEREKLSIPVAVEKSSDEEIKKWKVDADASRQAYFITKHRVKTNAVDLDAGDVAGHVKGIVN